MLARTSPSRRARTSAVALIAALAVGALAAFPAASSAAKKPKSVVKLSAGDLTVYRVGNDPQTIPDDIRDKVIATLTAYMNAATVKALQTGTVDEAALSATLSPAAVTRAAGPDRATLVDEGLPVAVDRVVVTAQPIALSGLADADGHVVVVTAGVTATAKTKTAKGRVKIIRKGDFVLSPDGDAWKIGGYDLVVDRSGKGLGAAGVTPTTAAPATTGTAAK